MDRFLNTIQQGDCIRGLGAVPAGVVDLAFADPPFNIGYDYDVYDDALETKQYLDWSRRWIKAVHRALKPDGTFWLAIGDEYAAELKVISQEIGFHCRSWVVWYYTFGVNCTRKFTRSHAHLFHFVKDPEVFTFLSDVPENRIPSARQLVYGDARANPKGRLPDDTWILRPQDAAGSFTDLEDTWYFPRVAGTFKERAGFHGCQMPEQLLGRIIRFCSEPGETVLDPFSGSATTLAVAKKMGRNYLGFEISEEYVARGNERLAEIEPGDKLVGSAEPTASAPSTAEGRALGGKPKRKALFKKQAELLPEPAPAPVVEPPPPVTLTDAEYDAALIAAFGEARDGWSLDRVIADPSLDKALAEACRRRGLPGDVRRWNTDLFALRKVGALAAFVTEQRTEITWEACDPYLFASELALQQLIDAGASSLDAILCDPALAAKFDSMAACWSPGFTSLDYRWGALKLRKAAFLVRSGTRSKVRLPEAAAAVDTLDLATVPEEPGVYVVSAGAANPGTMERAKPLYVGETFALRARIGRMFGDPALRKAWTDRAAAPLAVQWLEVPDRHRLRLNCQSELVTTLDTPWNWRELSASS